MPRRLTARCRTWGWAGELPGWWKPAFQSSAALLLGLAFAGFPLCGGEIKPAADAPQPLSPEESLKRFKLPPGFRIELVASEPLLADPVSLAFEARGRIFVCEIHGYNLEGHLDVTELNKTGVLDKTVRRVPASKEAQARAEKETYGTVKLLEDTDGDGRADRMSVWADHLPACYGVVPARAGVIVLCAPDIVYLLKPEDVADLLGYLREALATLPSVLTLFDDDRAFPALLNEGEGTATVATDEKFCGAASLAITPPQRFAGRIPGWNHRIVEHPQPGEYRYLRFAWKAPQAHGVMLELAADGQWPPPNVALRRYCAGQNTSGWQARQLSPTAPRAWTVVTVDLWKDFGDFTLTGLAPTAMGSPAFFDCIQLLRTLVSSHP